MRSAAGGEASPRRVAMDCLARREHSRAELERKLAARDFSGEEIAVTLQALEAEGLLSDQRFAEAFVLSRYRRGQGPMKVRAELAGRGVKADLAEPSLEALDWVQAAQRAREKKFGAELPADFPARARQARFLQYRGFETEQIRRALAGDREQDEYT